jgi:hypothetical protein
MAARLDPETLERLRTLPPREAFEECRRAVHRAGRAGSEDFLEIYEQLVEAGIVSWEEIEGFER